MKPALILFDVNETLLDLKALAPEFAARFGSADAMGEWFARMLHGSLVANHVRRYRPFGLIGIEALVVTAQRRGVALDPDDAVTLVAEMRRLPPHPDVPGALERLRSAGFPMATLTNGDPETAAEQLAHAGIDGFFERKLSVESVERFKPAPEPYLHAGAILGVEIDRMLMVAAHDWDIAGARSVGMPGAYLARPGAVWGLPDPPPELVAPDLGALAELLIGNSEPR